MTGKYDTKMEKRSKRIRMEGTHNGKGKHEAQTQ